MPFTIIRDDLANVAAGAVVLPSNESLSISGGVGLAVAQRAGLSSVQHACDLIGGCRVGTAVSTLAFDFPADYLIHAVGPDWRDPEADAGLLRSAYDAALGEAERLEVSSVAMPLLSAGTYGCPADVSLTVALASVKNFLKEHELEIILVLFDTAAMRAVVSQYGPIDEYVDDTYAFSHRTAARSGAWNETAPMGEPCYSSRPMRSAPSAYNAQEAQAAPKTKRGPSILRHAAEAVSALPSLAKQSLGELLESLDASFSDTLFTLIDEKGLTDAEVYNRANLSRQHFSKIRCNPDYKPTKPTVLALCVALELSLAETEDLLQRAGYSLTHTSKFDVIIEYFINEGIYDIFAINETLFAYDQPLL